MDCITRWIWLVSSWPKYILSRMSLNLSSTTDNVDLIYNGLSDKYETLYPFLRDVNNEGGLTLLTKEEMENKQARILTRC
jgi:hypothetical protein